MKKNSKNQGERIEDSLINSHDDSPNRKEIGVKSGGEVSRVI